jgi:PAS domain S-box-containing protein
MNQLTIANKLYGRERDIITLLASFERISRGQGEVLLVPGSSGVGKTALVQELQVPIRDRNGFFIRGKFDQYQQNIPYSAFRQALAELCRELQSGDAQQRSRLKADILQSIGTLGQVLVDLVPEFESLLGAQPPLGDISPQEARHRFADVFRHFLKAICRPEHPLVLFLDDWQWADAASFELLKQMQVGITLRYLLVIVSYRDNEVDSGHPLVSTVDDLRSHAVPVEVLSVKNITVEDVREIVADTLKPAIKDGEGLAAVIHGQTLGNPFFVRSFLNFLYEFKLIWFDPARNGWEWGLNQTGAAELPGDVVELFVLKLRRLDSDRRSLFSLAACLGNRFDLETLSLISGRPSGECLALLFSDQAKDMLLPWADGGGDSAAEDIRAPKVIAFLHDRVQQAAYGLIEPAELPKILLRIGRLLLSRLRPEQLLERLFEVVSDLNAGCDLVQDTAEQLQMVELNITAGRKAYAAAAYRSALQFYRAANRFLEAPEFAEHLWRDRHELAMRLFKERAECEFLEGNRHEAEKCIQQAVAHAKTALERADALNTLIVQYTLLARYPEAIAVGRQALDVLGISLPGEGYEEARNDEIAQVRQELGSREVSALIELPVMSHPEMLMASKILITLGPPCYRSDQRLWGVIVPKVVNLTLRYGNIPQVGYSHTAFGGLLGWVDNDYATAKEFGELATRLMTSTFQSPSDQSVFYLMIGSSIRHWFKHLKHGTQDYTDAVEIGLRSSNLQYAAYAFGHNMYCRFYQGVPLAGLIQESQRSLEFSRTRVNQWAIDLLEGGLNIFGALSGESPALNGNGAWSEEAFLQRVKDHHNIQVTCIYKVLKTFSLLVSGDYEDALVLSDETEPLIYTVGTQGLLPWPEHVFARVLILTALYSKAEAERRTQWRAELDQMLSQLRIWADNCPENFEHKYLLAAAELARIDGRPVAAMSLYDQAVEAAQAGNFVQWQGMANERAYRFWLECGNERLAQVYWQQAYVCYDQWGATAKVRSMETAYRTCLAKNLPAGDSSGKPAEKLEREIKNVLLERQIQQLRSYASQMQQTRLRVEAVTQAEELAQAMQRVRVEIAERKRTEEALRESEEKFKKLFVEAPLGIALIDSLTGYIYEVNPMFAKIVGRTMEGIAAIDWMSITHPEDVQEDLDNMALLNAGEIAGFQMEKRFLHQDGTPVWINMTIASLHVEDKAHPRHLCLVEDINERKRAEAELETMHKQLVEASRRGGMAEVATNVLHNVGNVLNSVNISTGLVIESVKQSRASSLARVVALLQEHAHDLGTFITHDSRGKHLPAHLAQLSEHLLAEQAANIRELDSLRQNVEHIKEIVAMQQNYATFGGVKEMINVADLVEDSLRINAGALSRHRIEVIREFETVPPLNVEKHKILQILVNLLRNAKHACQDSARSDKRITVRVAHGEGGVRISVIDNGVGIPPENLIRIFNYGFTTRKGGHGFGLHSGALAAQEMGGSLTVHSDGVGQGAAFTLELPCPTRENSHE